jgi:hypothetical protein
VLLCLCFTGKAQSDLLFKQNTPPLFLPAAHTICMPGAIHLNVQPLRHTAIFCLMEDKLYTRFNIWIKLRAGNDEIYRKQIAQPFERMN